MSTKVRHEYNLSIEKYFSPFQMRIFYMYFDNFLDQKALLLVFLMNLKLIKLDLV